MTGRAIVAVAVTTEIGSENARILYRTILQQELVYDVNLESDLDRPAGENKSEEELC